MNKDIIVGLADVSLFLENIGKKEYHETVEDACQIISKKRPRVLTYDEAKELKIGTDIWIEYKRKLMIIAGTFKSFTQGAVYKWFNLYGVEFSIRAIEYGKSVRFWTGRPTGKQREEVGWNE